MRLKMPLAVPLAAVLGAACTLPGRALRTLGANNEAASQGLESYGFRDYVTEFGRTYEEGSEQWNARRDLFEKTRKEILEFNAMPDRMWTMGIGPFMDYTDAERKRLLGYKGLGSQKAPRDAPAEASSLSGGEHLPTHFSVERPESKLLNLIRDQGNCGSCWAEAATSTLEGQLAANKTAIAMLMEMHQKRRVVPLVPEDFLLSSQAVVSCTPNKRHCGGTGGCSGATVELAYDMVLARGGLPFDTEWPYESGQHGAAPACKDYLLESARVSITGYTTLPVNKLLPLKQALVQTGGPVAVSVDASHWFHYAGGIFSDTDFGKGDFTVNHAVTLMAYKEPGTFNRGYWLIKNSWGPYWGEGGRIRLEMKPLEETHCGWDFQTHDGVACDGDPDTAHVCGTCGILYDSAFPTGVHLKGL